MTKPPSRAERTFSKQLVRLARQIGLMIDRHSGGTATDDNLVTTIMDRYSKSILGWAVTTAGRMLTEIDGQSRRAFERQAKDMSVALRREIQTAPTGQAMRGLLAEQVELIQSMPIEAAQRVHRITLEARMDDQRAETLVKAIQETGHVTESRAKLIARTEVGRTAAALDQARAQHIGSPGYIWQTTEDADVRPSHKEMNGKFVRWEDPPTLDGLTGHAGALPNCRCTRLISFADTI